MAALAGGLLMTACGTDEATLTSAGGFRPAAQQEPAPEPGAGQDVGGPEAADPAVGGQDVSDPPVVGGPPVGGQKVAGGDVGGRGAGGQVPGAPNVGGQEAGAGTCPTPPGKYSQQQILRVRPQVQAMIAEDMYSVGNGANAISADLRPGREELAARVLARFGDVVEISIAGIPYCGKPGVAPRCSDVPGSDALPPGLHLTLRLERGVTKATAELGGTLTVRNDSMTLFEMDPGQPLSADVVTPGTRTVVAHFTGAVAGTGLSLRLRNGEEESIPVSVGMARCDGQPGSVLAPGTYGVRAGIGPNEGPPVYLAPEVPLRIEAP